ncbi:cation transporter [Nicoliella spurrieriana]|uniref:Cation transporter n=1 Tax=Nicoliella spurrieriana TaxID=2925830 RepID=A0A976X661_9LACO|nr:cation transporter [Nicoliella spurrieriana]UQS87284.1 cation transporter [Nicoliella spurrieriana]
MENSHSRIAKRALIVEFFSISWMLVEFMVGFFAGLKAHSILLIAFGLDSVLEVIAGSILVWRLQKEFNGEDATSIKIAEERAGKLVNWILVLLSIYIVINSVFDIVTRETSDSSMGGILISVASLIIMPILIVMKRKLGHQLRSEALIEESMCNVTCAYLAATVLIGIVLTQLFGLWWAESIAALGVAFLIAKEAIPELREG